MSTFHVPVQVGTPERDRFERIDALVDTGASYTTLATSTLRKLNVRPAAKRSLLLAKGQEILRDVGQTWLRVDGQEVMTVVVFGDEATLPLLGAVTLEELGLGVDPLAQKLVPVRGYLT